MGLLVLAIGMTFRLVVSNLAVFGGDLTFKERLFVSLAWLPKATVQAAIGPMAYDAAINGKVRNEEHVELGLKVLTIAVLVILVTAPIGAIAIMTSAPKLLNKTEIEVVEEKRKESP